MKYLQITKNGTDISGKTLRESEKNLSNNLPDLTKDLIASTIILGQGMPNKFSSFSPSGRKDLLEKLTKSDFMLDDIKTRITARLQDLNTELRQYEDSLLVNNTKLSSNRVLLTNSKNELDSIKNVDYSKKLEESSIKINNFTTKLAELEDKIKEKELSIDNLNSRFITLTAEKAKVSDEEFNCYNTAFTTQNELKIKNQTSIRIIENEIKKLESIKDICPTCGQRIQGVVKPDTTEQKAKVKALQEDLSTIDAKLVDISEKHKTYIAQINTQYVELDNIQSSIKDIRSELTSIKSEYNIVYNEFNQEKELFTKLSYDRQNDERIHTSLKNKITELEVAISQLDSSIKISEAAKVSIEERIATIKKIDSLVKRDFRGYLLSNIIDYLNNKVKEYSSIVFNHNELNIYLDGNALDIYYCNRLYETLSGGEKQRVDLITQFAIRDLLQVYFNYSSNILVLDEITDNLDKIATTRIFDLITDKLKDVESVFIISHHDVELEIPVDSELHITKNENSISSIKEN